MNVAKTNIPLVSEREVDWVQCDGGCELWFHLFCVGLDKRDVKEDEDFICRVCQARGAS